MVDFESVRRFVSVVDCGGISAAADFLHVSPSTVSRSVSQLETELGIPLFDAQRDKLTEAGQVALPAARQILDDTRRLEAQVSELAERRGALRVASCSPSPLWLLTRIFEKEFPSTIIGGEVVSTSAEAIQKLFALEADVAVTTGPVSSSQVHSTILMHERLVASVPKGTRLSRQQTCSFADFSGQTVDIYKGIGFWYDVIMREIPDATFVVQPDFVVYLTTSRSPSAIHFDIDVPEFDDAGVAAVDDAPRRVFVPVSDASASVTYYASWRRDQVGKRRELLGRLGATLEALQSRVEKAGKAQA